jgi:hypothetical protein
MLFLAMVLTEIITCKHEFFSYRLQLTKTLKTDIVNVRKRSAFHFIEASLANKPS